MSSKNSKPSGGPGSIARNINFEFWMREFSHLLLLDLVLAGAAAAAFFIWCEQQVPAGDAAVSRDFLNRDSLETAVYVLTLASGKTCEFLLLPLLQLCRIPAVTVLALEGLFLIGNLFSVGTIRRKMKPLHEIALQTDELANLKIWNRPSAASIRISRMPAW